ncbi:MAG: hypothetical protein LBL13_14155 [Bacteroidales bacterium]|jgi:hypothetical protein|nr:hypothetical protein [Bacteroidales bacterium]
MAHFLGIVLRNQFNLFYRFGYTFISKYEFVEFDGNITSKTKEQVVRKFATITPFEYDEEYLILHLEKSVSEDSLIRFEIQDIVAIYPLSRQAKGSIEAKIDPRIKLEKPIFETILSEIESEIEKGEVEKAISALWKICKIEQPLGKYLTDIGFESIFKGLEHRKKGVKANKIQNGNYWEYLIAYDRFDYFPNSTLGCFYDAGQVFAFSTKRPTFEGSGLHTFLEKLNSENPTTKLPEIIKYLETEEQLKNYASKTTTGDIKQYIVAPLYLMLRDEIRKSEDITQTKLFKNLDYLKEFGDSFYYAVILLGAFFGFRKFYDFYYDTLNLRFYKNYKKNVQKIEGEKSKSPVENDKKKIKGDNTIVEKTEEKLLPAKIQIKESANNPDLAKKNDELSRYRVIIENALKGNSPVKLTDLADLIKDETGRKFNNKAIKGIIEGIEGIELTSVGRADAAKQGEPRLL